MGSRKDLLVRWVDFPAISHPTAESLISSARRAVLHDVENKMLELIPNWLKTQPSNISRIELEIYPLPYDTDFNMPSLYTILAPSLQYASISPETTPEAPERGCPSTAELNSDIVLPSSDVNMETLSATDIGPISVRAQSPSTAY